MMKMLKKTVLGAAMALALVGGAQASLTNMGGVLVDPDYTDGGEFDFISQFNFTQWYSTSNSNTEGVISNYNNASVITSVLGALDGSSSGTGYYLQGTGEFYRINGLSTSNGDVFCPGCELTFAFGGIELNGDSSFNISNAWALVKVDTTPDYTHPLSGASEVGSALDGDTWLKLAFTSLGFTSGNVGNGVVSATFEIADGLAMDYFDPKNLTYTADAKFITDVTGAPLTYSTGGNGSAYGNTTVPEPASLALVGLGLLGVGALRRRSKV